MTKRGEGARAVAVAVTASGFGGVLGALVLAVLIPLLKPIALSFGPPEIFMLIMFGITLIALVSGKSVLKGLIFGCFGLALSTVGLCPHSGVLRFGFDLLFLWDGINVVAVMVGIFAVAEMIDLGIEGGAIAGAEAEKAVVYQFRQVLEGIKDIFRHFWLSIRTALIGCFIGILPGLGAEVAIWVCYGHAVQTEKNNETFGKGDVRGVIAPETANNSKEGGSLLPTVAFGIPGSSGMAVLLGAFLVLGLVPGPAMLTEHLDIVWALVWIVVISNIIGAAIILALAPYMAKATFLRGTIMVPLVFILCFIGSFMANDRWENLVITFLFGILGYFMKKYDFPRPPLALGFVLGELADLNLTRSLDLWGPAFIGRPITLVLLILTCLSVLIPIIKYYRGKRRQKGAA
jgi:TctA family transporter